MVLSSNTTQGTNINIQQSPEVERNKTFDKQMTQNLLRFSSGGGTNITEMTEQHQMLDSNGAVTSADIRQIKMNYLQ